MKILILGAGKMGSFFVDLLSFDHECAVYEVDPKRMRFLYNTQRFTSMDEIDAFRPNLVINCVTLKYTLQVFDEVIPHLPEDCILSDISSVKTGFREYYEKTGRHYCSTHPMFGPTFANLGALSSENAIVINEGDYLGRVFFLDLYRRLGLNVHEYSFEEHDEAMAYSLSVPFVSTFVFSAVMKRQDAPGTRSPSAAPHTIPMTIRRIRLVSEYFRTILRRNPFSVFILLSLPRPCRNIPHLPLFQGRAAEWRNNTVV